MRWLVVILLMLNARVAWAQEEDDPGFIQGLIEGAVSDTGREVRLVGFQGALSSLATVDAITIADENGVWLRLDKVQMQWDRGALLSGEIDIGLLAAQTITFSRLPVTPDGVDMQDIAATPFKLPDLPVSVRLADINADEIILGEEILGEPLSATFEGNMTLESGEGVIIAALRRSDGKQGQFLVDAGYSNATQVLRLDLEAEEGENGVAARLLNIPDRPAIRLEIQGDAPLDDFAASLALSTNDVPRVTGEFSLLSSAPNDAVATPVPDRSFSLDLVGDLQPFVLDRFDRFFGVQTHLTTHGTRHGDGRLDLTDLSLKSDQLDISGHAALGPDYWPQNFALRGVVQSTGGEPVIIPGTGGDLTVGSLNLDLQFDVDQGDRWSGFFVADNVIRPDLRADGVKIIGSGSITPGDGTARGRFTADLRYIAEGLNFEAPGLSEAIGSEINGVLSFARIEEEPLVIRDFELTGAGIEAAGTAFIEGPDDRFITRADLILRSTDISRFSTLLGTSLSGQGDIALKGNIQPFDGIFEFDVEAETSALGIGNRRIDALLTGESLLSMSANRDETGLFLRKFFFSGEALTISGKADIYPDSITATLDGTLDSLSRIDPALSGPATLAGDIQTDSEGVITTVAIASGAGTQVDIDGSATPSGDGYSLRGDVRATSQNLGAFSGIVGQRLGGSLRLEASGRAETNSGAVQADVTARTQDLRAGPAGLDPLWRGGGDISANLTGQLGQRLRLTDLSVLFPNAQATGTASVSDAGNTRADLNLRLRDIGLFATDFSGPASADIVAEQDAQGWRIDGTAQGPNGTSTTINGRVENTGTANIRAVGQAPLGLANAYIAPQQIRGLADFDLLLSGPPDLSSVSGPVTIRDARLAAPTLRQSIEGISGTVQLGQGRASLNLTGSIPAGGTVDLSGPITLAAPFEADLSATGRAIVVRDPTLYETLIGAQLNISGPLSGGATINGQVNVGDTEIRVPTSAVSLLGELPEVTHLGPRPDVVRTLQRANLDQTPRTTTDAPSQGPTYPLNVSINAPARVFIRGRGLDAEMGGQVQLTGTTQAILPVGQLSLIRGRLDILGQRFQLAEGVVQLQGDFTPFVRLVATTEARTGTIVSIIVEGPIDEPEIKFESSPDLPQDEVLSQLLFGRSISDISPLQAVQLASAIATLSGKSDGGVMRDLREGLSLDDFDLTQADDGTAAVRAGKYVSENVYTDVTVSTGGRTEINLNLDITDDITARGTVSSDGETSIGIFFERDY